MNTPQKQITRIDLEASPAGSIIFRRIWREGWQDGDIHESEEMVDETIYRLLTEYEKQGFTVWMKDSQHGRALRGKTTRIDFVKIGDEWHLQKFPHGWTAKTRPITDSIKTAAEIDQAIAWCQQNGWTVRRWPEGARAWLGEIKPVRDTSAIRSMRRNVQAEFSNRQNIGSNKIFYDFAFDY